MPELGLAEYFSMAEALGIIATLFVILYFSKTNAEPLSRHPNEGSQRLR
jgi:hypothetical protein